MTVDEFNKKYKDYLEEEFYGLAIENQEVIDFLDKEFEKEAKINFGFKYSQIKLKFGLSRVYAESDKLDFWEREIDKIINKEMK